MVVGAKAGLSNLFTVATNHPGFTLGLQAINRIQPDRVDVLVWPIVVVGALTGALLFVVLRRLGIRTPAAGVVGAALAVNGPHLMYSGRVKPYILEVGAIVLLGFAVERLAGRRWRPALAVGWLVAALACASLGAFGFAAAAVATLVLATAPQGDRALRLSVLAVQGAVQAVMGLRLGRGYDSAQVAEDWETTYDGYFELGGPVDLARQLGRHLARLGQSFVDVPSPFAAALVLVAVGGLVAASRRGPSSIAARFFGGLLAVAFVGSLFDQVPFGPTPFHPVFPGARASLWLLPSIGFGLAVAVERIAERLGAERSRARAAWTGATAVAAVALVVVALPAESAYGELGTRSATERIEALRADDTVVFHFGGYGYLLGAEPPISVAVSTNPDSLHGFDVTLGEGRVPFPEVVTTDGVARHVGDASEVFVHDPFPGFAEAPRQAVGAALEELGFRLDRVERFDVNEVDVWTRDP